MRYKSRHHIRDVLMQTRAVPLLAQEDSLERPTELTENYYTHGHIYYKRKTQIKTKGRDA